MTKTETKQDDKDNKGGKGGKGEEDAGQKQSTTSPVEWIVAAAGMILLCVMLVYLAFLALGQDEGPPLPVITYSAPARTEAGFTVPYKVENKGKTAASQVIITGQLLRGEDVVEEREGMIDFIAQDSEQEGSLIFQRDPAQYRTVISVSGFTLP